MQPSRAIRGLDPSLLFMGVVAFLAWLFPEGGAKGGWLHPEWITKAGIVWIFFSQGLSLNIGYVLEGLKQWRVHVFIQGFSFVCIPLCMLLGDQLLHPWVDEEIRLGFLYLAILPTTISTSAIFAGRLGAPVASITWNILISNILGIFLVPAWTLWLLHSQADIEVPKAPLFGQIALMILAPMVIAMILQKQLEGWASRCKGGIRMSNMLVIYFIIYAALCDSFQSGLWENYGFGWVAGVGAGTCLVLVLIHGAAWVGTGWMGSDRPLRLAVVFTAAQKTMAVGAPLAQTIFAAVVATGQSVPPLALVLLPLMFYHPLQLMLGALVIGRIEAAGQTKITTKSN